MDNKTQKSYEEVLTPKGKKFRYFKLGFREMFGSLVQQGAIIEELKDGKWIYNACMHPDDVEGYLKNL